MGTNGLSEFSIWNCLNVKEPLVRNKRSIWSLSTSNRSLKPQPLISEANTLSFTQTGLFVLCCENIPVWCIDCAFLCFCHIRVLNEFDSEISWFPCSEQALCNWSFSDSNGIRTRNYKGWKRRLTDLAKLAKWISQLYIFRNVVRRYPFTFCDVHVFRMFCYLWFITFLTPCYAHVRVRITTDYYAFRHSRSQAFC